MKTKTVRRVVIELSAGEYEYLRKYKGDMTWKEFLFELLRFKEETLNKKLRYLCEEIYSGNGRKDAGMC